MKNALKLRYRKPQGPRFIYARGKNLMAIDIKKVRLADWIIGDEVEHNFDPGRWQIIGLKFERNLQYMNLFPVREAIGSRERVEHIPRKDNWIECNKTWRVVRPVGRPHDR